MVFQCPYGTRETSRRPRKAQPRIGAMLVLSLSKDRPCLVDEDEALGVEPSLILLPPGPQAGDVRTLLLAWQNAFF
jgi:hypothetical protein